MTKCVVHRPGYGSVFAATRSDSSGADSPQRQHKIVLRQYKNLSPLSVINSRKASLCSVCREAQHTDRYRN